MKPTIIKEKRDIKMKLSDTTRKILGVLTVWHVVYVVIFFLYFFVEILAFQFNLIDKFMNSIFNKYFFKFHFLSSLNFLGLWVFYIVYLFKTDRVPKDKKALWAAVILLGHMFAVPVFWYFYVRKKPESKDQET
ncbi:MAG: hypothetical protein ACYSWZ_02690 [Planctomycetota bacterium]|jgi:hypothetical protein